MTTAAQAIDDMLALVKAGANSQSPAVFVAWEGVKGLIPPTDKPWLRPSVRHGPARQISLTGGLSKIRFERDGTLFVQVFYPLNNSGSKPAMTLAEAIRSRFLKVQTPSHVWFRNQRINEVGPSGDFYQVNVLIDFTYDEIV